MSTINPAWRDLYPEDLAALLVVIARAHKMPPKAGKFIRMGKWGAERASSAIARGMEARGYEVEHNRRRMTVAGYKRGSRPSIIARKDGLAISVEFADRKPELTPVKRLGLGEGIRVLVLTESPVYRPLDPADKASELHRIPPELLANVDYLIPGRQDQMMPIDRKELAKCYFKREIETALILQLIKEAWDRGYPLSTHGRVFEYDDQPTRYVPKLLYDLYELHPKVTRQTMLRLKREGYIIHDKIARNWLKGLKLTKKGEQELARNNPKPG